MGRHVGPKCKLCRSEGAKLFLKGERCYSSKCAFVKRSYAPGQHGQAQKRVSEFGIRLREKQKARRIFGLSERQFRKYFELASKTKGSTGGKLMEYLERRLDNVVYRLSIAPSRAASRQMVRDGHVLINGKKVNIPSYLVSKDEVIGIKEKSLERVKAAVEKAGEKTVPAWMSFDKEKIEGKVLSIPRREEMDAIIEENLIVEFYSR